MSPDGLRGTLDLPRYPEACGAVEPLRQRVGLGGSIGEQLVECAPDVLLGDAQSAGHLHEDFGRDGAVTGGRAPPASAELGCPAEYHLDLGGGKRLLGIRRYRHEAPTYDFRACPVEEAARILGVSLRYDQPERSVSNVATSMTQ